MSSKTTRSCAKGSPGSSPERSNMSPNSRRLSSMRELPLEAQYPQKDASWLVMRRIIWGPGIVLPTFLIRKVLMQGDKYRISNYDLRLSKWFERNAVPVYYTFPSLVNHRNGPILGRRSERVAGTPTGSPLNPN